MSRPLHDSSLEKASAAGPGQPVMVYVCECGVKWSNSTKTAWECKCGRQLVKRNGIIHTALGQAQGQTASRARNVRAAPLY
jgi:hypothetical protein